MRGIRTNVLREFFNHTMYEKGCSTRTMDHNQEYFGFHEQPSFSATIFYDQDGLYHDPKKGFKIALSTWSIAL